MRLPKRARKFFGAIAFLVIALVLSAAPALAQSTPRVGVGNVPSTHVRALGAVFVAGDGGDYACVAYANDAQSALSLARFKLFFLSTENKDLGMQTIEVAASVAPSARMMVPTSDVPGDPAHMANCKLLPFAKEKIGMVMMLPDRFEFADGTSWSLKPATPNQRRGSWNSNQPISAR